MLDKCGKNVNIEHGAFLASGSGIEIGNNSGIVLTAAMAGPLSIGDDVMMAPNVTVVTQNHETSDLQDPCGCKPRPRKR